MTRHLATALVRLTTSISLLAVSPAVLPAQDSAPAKESRIRVVSCDEHVKSTKRGIGANKLHPEDFVALSKGASWWYNWHYETQDSPPEGVAMSFIPMVWGSHTDSLAGLERYLTAGNKPRGVLAINEPNLRGQSFLPPKEAAALYTKVKAVTDRHGIPLVGPQMSIGSSPADSMQAFDPIEGKDVTYTFMVPYMKAFLHYAQEAGTEVGPIAIHPYADAGALIGLTTLAQKEFKRPIWVTEFNNSDESPAMESIRIYLMQAVDFMERSPSVEGYAFFKERAAGHPKISLLWDEPGKLTPLGEAYVQLPVHDPNLYYRIPGRLQAENYVAMDRMEIWPTSDSDGFAHMTSGASGASLDYHVQVDQAGTYRIQIRVTGQPGKLTLLKGNQVLASASAAPEGQFATVETSVHLFSGPQTIRLRSETAVQGINWIEFSKK